MNDLALVITIDFDGNLHLETSIPRSCIKGWEKDGATVDIDLPIPQAIAPRIGKALIEAASAGAKFSGRTQSH